MKPRRHAAKVYVAMSGGVDSSVAAALLKKEGFDVVGVFMRPWQDETIQCLWQKDKEDAMRVASQLDIPFYVWDFSQEYGDKVTKYMIAGYRKGITPNPDVMCNKEIKFGLFFKRAMQEGADFIATGHYAQIKKSKDSFKLLKGDDPNKDQSYFLWTLTQKQLAKTLFPVGDLPKSEVRKLAKKFKLPNFDKKDSQGVCFVGPLDMKSFLKHHIKPKPGAIIYVDGRKLGTHDGMQYYTIGQRHGLDLGVAGGPYYVVRKDAKKNVIIVGSEKDLLSKEATITHIQWTREGISFPLSLDAKIRYRTQSQKAVLHKDGHLVFKKSQRAITPGQSAVFYKGKELLGGGIIL
jgi:tRNA-specific 2-thiouridylase